jgi:prepilin-type N-terminal cleavage/methylation domain-containing protein/prepilin-type processing-associated H-X9-DG protein
VIAMNKRNAFTLIELLVVIAIIALLVSILMPSLQKAKELAKTVVCSSNLRSMTLAVNLYAEDYDDQIPQTTYWGYDYLSWAMRVGRIADDDDILPYQFVGMPGERRICTMGYVDFDFASETEGTFKCPGYQDQVPGKATWQGSQSRQYSMSQALGRKLDNTEEGDPNKPCTRITDLKRAPVLIADCNVNPGGGRYPYTVFQIPLDGDVTQNTLELLGPWPVQIYVNGWGRTDPVDFYGHSGKASNLGFVDGHAESQVKLKTMDWLKE